MSPNSKARKHTRHSDRCRIMERHCDTTDESEGDKDETKVTGTPRYASADRQNKRKTETERDASTLVTQPEELIVRMLRAGDVDEARAFRDRPRQHRPVVDEGTETVAEPIEMHHRELPNRNALGQRGEFPRHVGACEDQRGEHGHPCDDHETDVAFEGARPAPCHERYVGLMIVAW